MATMVRDGDTNSFGGLQDKNGMERRCVLEDAFLVEHHVCACPHAARNVYFLNRSLVGYDSLKQTGS